jgi:hypothetical protein
MAGAGDVGSLVGGQDLCMASVSSACGFHMQMGGLLCSGLARGDTVSGLVGPWVREAVDFVEAPVVSLCPRGVLEDFGLLPSCPVVPLGLR